MTYAIIDAYGVRTRVSYNFGEDAMNAIILYFLLNICKNVFGNLQIFWS